MDIHSLITNFSPYTVTVPRIHRMKLQVAYLILARVDTSPQIQIIKSRPYRMESGTSKFFWMFEQRRGIQIDEEREVVYARQREREKERERGRERKRAEDRVR